MPLSDEDRDALQRSLTLAARLVDAVSPLSAVQVQELYNDLLEDAPDEESIHAAGAAFGMLLLSGRPYEWFRVTDDLGSELALGVFGLEIHCHPISMIENRLEDKEEVDIAELVDMTVAHIDALIIKGADLRPSEADE